MKTKKNHSAFFIIVFIIVLIIHVISSIYPQYVSRVLAAFLPIPVLIINYYNKAKKPNSLYMISFLFTYLAATFYILKIDYSFTIALLLYSIGIAIYTKLVLDKINSIKWHYFPFLLISVLATPVYYLYDNFSISKLTVLLIYGTTILLFFYTALSLYINKKSTINRLPLISSVIYIVSTITSFILIFTPKETLTENIATVTFWTSHLYMSLFMIKHKNSVFPK